jgi:hypothetical protein
MVVQHAEALSEATNDDGGLKVKSWQRNGLRQKNSGVRVKGRRVET